MSESSEKLGEPKTFFGFNHTPEEISKFTAQHIHKTRSQKGGLFARLFGLGSRVDTIEFDASGIREATRVPQIFRHNTPEPPVIEGKFWRDRKGRMHSLK